MSSSRGRFPARLCLTVALLLAAVPFAGCQHRQSQNQPNAEDMREPDATVLDRDEMPQGAVSSVEQLIEGRIAGVRVRRGGGRVWFEIRGPSTFSGSTEALIVVDGVETSANALLGMNPADVDRIQVLKDAGAAIYGVRGANGVLLITTRRSP